MLYTLSRQIEMPLDVIDVQISVMELDNTKKLKQD